MKTLLKQWPEMFTSLSWGLLGYDHEREIRLDSALLERFRALPGVASASLSRYELRAATKSTPSLELSK